MLRFCLTFLFIISLCSCRKNNTDTENLINKLNNTILLSQISQNQKLILNNCTLKFIGDNEYCLVLFIPTYVCNTCVDELMSQLVDKNKLMYLISSDQNRYAKLFRLRNKINEPNTFQVLPDSISFVGKSNKEPVFFVIDRYLNMYNLFIPDRDLPKQTITYLELIKEKYGI